MKKILVILACVAMLFSFASCDNNNGGAAADYLDKVEVAADVMSNVKTIIETADASADFGGSVTGVTVAVASTSASHVDAVFTIADEYTEEGMANGAVLTGEFTLSFDRAGTEGNYTYTSRISTADLQVVNGYDVYPIEISGDSAFDVTAFSATAPVAPAETGTGSVTATLSYPSTALSVKVGNEVLSTSEVFKAAGIVSAEAVKNTQDFVAALESAFIPENLINATVTGETNDYTIVYTLAVNGTEVKVSVPGQATSGEGAFTYTSGATIEDVKTADGTIKISTLTVTFTGAELATSSGTTTVSKAPTAATLDITTSVTLSVNGSDTTVTITEPQD